MEIGTLNQISRVLISLHSETWEEEEEEEEVLEVQGSIHSLSGICLLQLGTVHSPQRTPIRTVGIISVSLLSLAFALDECFLLIRSEIVHRSFNTEQFSLCVSIETLGSTTSLGFLLDFTTYNDLFNFVANNLSLLTKKLDPSVICHQYRIHPVLAMRIQNSHLEVPKARLSTVSFPH